MASKKKTNVDEDAIWRTTIEEAHLNEETWKVKVIMIESAGGEQESIFLNKFEIFAAKEKRFVVKNICKTETIFMINQLGGDQKVKDPNLRVFEECQYFLSNKNDIPSDFLALVIKHLILKMKDEFLYIRRQRLEVKQGMQRESSTMLNRAEVKGTVCVKVEEPPPPPPSVKGKGKGDGEPTNVPEQEEGKKFSTQLRVRGEEWRDKVYVDDFPTDGPNLYVAVTGFVEPHLAGSLVKIGIPLTAVVQIRINPTMTTVPSSLYRATKRGQSLTELLADKSFKFWEDLQQLRIHESTTDVFKDTAFIVFSPPYWQSDNLSGNSDIIYNELCYLMYDVQDLSRQHLHYLENMNIMHISKDVSNEFIIEHYQQIINDLRVPLECVTIYSVLDSILETACFSLELGDIPSNTTLSSAITFNEPKTAVENSANLVKQIFNTLCNTQSVKKKYRLTYGQEHEENKDPIVLDYGDFAKYITFQLADLKLDNIVFSSLLGMPIHNLWHNQPQPSDELEAKINFHVNLLLSCFDRADVETAELKRLIHILACRKLYTNRSSLKKRHLPTTTITEFKKKYLKRSVLAEPLARCDLLVASGHNMSASFPSMTKSDNEYECSFSQSHPDPGAQRIKLLFDCPDISELVTAAEIESDQPIKHNMIDDFDFFEDLTGICAFQVMRDAFNNFNCVDYKYCEVTDCFILMFFNSHDNDGIAREEWRSHLATPLCLQDFFDFVLEEQYVWIQNEEKLYDENLLLASRSISKDFVNPLELQSCIETTDVEKELLMEGSLKYEELIQLEAVSLETLTEITESVPTKSPISFDVDSKSNKKARAARQKLPKYKQFYKVSDDESMEIPVKPFLGYDLGDRRVEVFGKDAMFFSRDGTKVTSLYTLTIPINLEYIVLNILPGNSYNEFWVHKALGDNVKPEIKDTCESFRITSKDRVLINVRKQMYQAILEDISTGDVIITHEKKVVDEPSETKETKYFHSLFVSWPNGMITETVYEDNSPVISHIKQYYSGHKPDLDEERRCISLNGEVIIFKPSNDIEVLKPDGTWIKIEKYYKRLVPSQVVVETLNELSDKSKKRIRKSPIVLEKPITDIPLKYEVVVNEFEIIESSGLRQKWIEDVPLTMETLLIKTAADYCLGEVFSRRMDGTNILMNKDGLHCVTFPDKTRIVTSYVVDEVEVYPEWTEEEIEYFESFEPDAFEGAGSRGSRASQRTYGSSGTSSLSKKIEEEEFKEKERTDGYVFIHIVYTIEHPNFSTITINNVYGTISVESPNDTTVIVDKNNNYDFMLDSVTTANFDGKTLNISYEACCECRAFTSCNVTIMKTNEDNCSPNDVNQVWLKMKDSFNTQVVVTNEGAINISDDTVSGDTENDNKNSNDEKEPDAKSESSLISHGKCREMYLAKNLRFFILRRDLNCAELLHRALVDEYQRACRWQPWCSINQYDTFGDHRNLVSILTPIHLTETEKWVMDSKQAGKPKFMTYKDLKPDTGKGFYHWMRPYERFVPQPRKPENVLPERLPRAYILRTLEREWNEEKRKQLKGGRELITALLRYRYVMQTDSETLLTSPIVDPRPEDERQIDDIIQTLGHRIYEDLKNRISDDIQSRAKLSITTKPPVQPEQMSFEGESFEEEETDEAKQKLIDEEREILVNEADAGEMMSPALRRYWRRRAEEYKEEQFYKYLLREGSVPPYYRNVLGGAIWWEVNNATDEAVTRAERRKMKCVCVDNEST